MARDYKAMEEEFIADLKSRSGRSLSEWMAAIAAKGLRERDEIIDWLHPQGFTFEHASWLERIHNNAGRPIYGGAEQGERPPEPRANPVPPRIPSPAPAPARAAPVTTSPAGSADPADIEALLARGKAYRMLAVLLVGEAQRALPGLAVTAAGDLIALGRPGRIAVVAVTAREVRIGLALGDRSVLPPAVPPKGLGNDPTITQMLVLNDARQVDEALIELLRLADRTVNPAGSNH